MRKFWGKAVNNMSKLTRKTRGRMSTDGLPTRTTAVLNRVKVGFVPRFFQLYTQPLSTHKSPPLPLVEHYFYPVSTAPTTITTKGKFKER